MFFELLQLFLDRTHALTVPLPEYIASKDTYCIRYLGNNPKIITELKIIGPLIEIKYGLKIKLSFSESEELFAGCADITDSSSLEKFLLESDLPVPKL